MERQEFFGEIKDFSKDYVDVLCNIDGRLDTRTFIGGELFKGYANEKFIKVRIVTMPGIMTFEVVFIKEDLSKLFIKI